MLESLAEITLFIGPIAMAVCIFWAMFSRPAYTYAWIACVLLAATVLIGLLMGLDWRLIVPNGCVVIASIWAIPWARKKRFEIRGV